MVDNSIRIDSINLTAAHQSQATWVPTIGSIYEANKVSTSASGLPSGTGIDLGGHRVSIFFDHVNGGWYFDEPNNGMYMIVKPANVVVKNTNPTPNPTGAAQPVNTLVSPANSSVGTSKPFVMPFNSGSTIIRRRR